MSDNPLTSLSTEKQIRSEAIRRGSFYTYDPSLSTVLGAFTKEAFIGTGTMREALLATEKDWEMGNLNITGPTSFYRHLERKLTGAEPSAKIGFEEWKESEYFREGLKYEPGMTVRAAQILADEHDRLEKMGVIMSRASGVEKVLGMTGAFAGGIFEPRNLAGGVGAAVVLGGAHGMLLNNARRAKAIAKTAKGLEKVAGKGGTVKRAVAEGFAGAAVLEVDNILNADTLQKDYTMADSLLNIGLSMAASGVIQGGVNYVGKKRARAALIQEQIDASAVAVSQLSQGKKPDTEIVTKLYESALENERPPTQYSKEDYDTLNNVPDNGGIDRFFETEARMLRSRLDELETRAATKEVTIKDGVGGIKRSGREIDKPYRVKGDQYGVDKQVTEITLPNGRNFMLFRDDVEGHWVAYELDENWKELPRGERFSVADNLSIYAGETQKDAIASIKQLTDDVVIDPETRATLDTLEQEAGIRPDDTDEEIAKKLQEFYAKNDEAFGDLYPDLVRDPDAEVQSPEDIMFEYEEGYEDWREVDLYDDINPDQYYIEADEITTADNDLSAVEKDNATLEEEFDEMIEAGLMDTDDQIELDAIREREAIDEEIKTAAKQGVFCLTR